MTSMDFFDELRDKFRGVVNPSPAAFQTGRDQISIGLLGPDVRPVADYLRSAYASRLVTVFAEDRVSAEGVFYNYYVFEQPGEPCYLILQAPIDAYQPRFPSLAAELPAVNWQEREIQDWFGLEATGHPNPRRVALHDNWPDVHPLRKDFPLRHGPAALRRGAPRLSAHAGRRRVPDSGRTGACRHHRARPLQFRGGGRADSVSATAHVLHPQGHREAVRRHADPSRRLPGGEHLGRFGFSHGTAFCQAIENAAGIELPPRARVMRTILLELERVCNHIADIGAIATDVGFVVANAHAGRLREMVVRLNEGLTGSRLLRGMVCVGGVRRAWSLAQRDLLRDTVIQVEREFDSLVALMQSSDSTRDRLEHTGILRPETAKELGIVGVGGRASGVDLDVRRDHPYAAYDRYPFRVPVYQAGDVLHRMQVRVDEVKESLAILRAAANDLTEGAYCAPAQPVPPGRCALSAVEGWRGEILHWMRTGAGQSPGAVQDQGPVAEQLAGLVEAVQGNIIADFPVINKSFNLSYSGTDR